MVSESSMQAQIRLQAAQDSVWLMRNNSGVLNDKNGRPVRFGIGNDSATVNAKLKSSDLIGIRPVLVTEAHVGQVIGQFIAVEAKPPTFRGPAGDDRALAQQAWMNLVRHWGGVAGFAPTVTLARRIWGGE